MKTGTVRVKCLAQEHNTMTRPGLEPGPLDPESSALTTRPLHLSQVTKFEISISAQLMFIREISLSTWPLKFHPGNWAGVFIRENFLPDY